MRMMFKEDILFIDIEGDFNLSRVNDLKYRVFNVLDQYEVINIVLNTKNASLRGGDIGIFINEYKERYNGKVKVQAR